MENSFPELIFHLREDLLEYNVVDLLLNGEYSGTLTIRANLMVSIAESLRREGSLNVDIRDGRRTVNNARTT